MNRVYPPSSLLRRLLDESLSWPAVGAAHLLIDLGPGYALKTAASIPLPRLITTLNQCPLYLSDLLRCQPEGIIAFSNGYNLDQIAQALAEIAAGRPVYIGPQSLETGLTSREEDVVRIVALGCDNWEIAQELSVTEKTVRNTLAGVLPKLGLKNRVELSHYYLGILDITRNIKSGYCPGLAGLCPD